jgi:hypothetical protein
MTSSGGDWRSRVIVDLVGHRRWGDAIFGGTISTAPLSLL